MSKPRLYPEDQARVDRVTHTGINSVERKPFKVKTLLAVIMLAMVLLSLISYLIARLEGVV